MLSACAVPGRAHITTLVKSFAQTWHCARLLLARTRLVYLDDESVAPDAAGPAEQTNAAVEWWALRRVDDMIVTGGRSVGCFCCFVVVDFVSFEIGRAHV